MRKLICLLLLLIPFCAGASHLVGGDFSLKKIGTTPSDNRYLLTLKVFRDCEHGIPPFNVDLSVGMYEKGTNILIKKYYMGNTNSVNQLVFTSKGCIRIPTGCTELGLYIDTIELDPRVLSSPYGYYFSWERCCRNTIIKNIVVGAQPGITGMALYMEIPPLSIVNKSTPVFNRDPLTLLCVDNPFSFNYNVTDADGDSLVYSLVTPLKGTTTSKSPNDPGQTGYPILNEGPYPEAQWQIGYGLSGNMMDGTPKLEINAQTGELTVTPKKQGVYVVAIRVEEYRNGVKLGEVRRELQFTISSCENNPNPVFNDSSRNRTYVINATDTLNIPIHVNDPNGDSVRLNYSGTLFGKPLKPPYATIGGDISGLKNISTRLKWNTLCDQASPDTQYLYLEAKDNGCPINKRSVSTIRIIVKPTPTPEPPNVVCLERPDVNSLQINFGDIKFDKYFKYMFLIRKNPDSTRTTLDTFYNHFTERTYIDKTAFDHAHNHYIYYFVGMNICDKLGRPSYQVNSDPGIPKEPDTRYIYTASVVDNRKVLIQWEHAREDNFLGYWIYKKENRPDDVYTQFKLITKRNDTTFYDSSVNVNQKSYCYRIIVSNKCGFSSKNSNEACTILLKGQSKDFASNLTWSSYRAWAGGVKDYHIFRRDPGNSDTMLGYTAPDALNFVDEKLNIDWGAYWYKVVGNEGAGGGKAASQSNEVYLIQKPMVYPPNVFTPNGDEINDLWQPLPVFVKEYSLEIYNRWGELVFRSDDKHKYWDGSYRGNEKFNNAFVYKIMYTGWDNSVHYLTGTVTQLR